MVFRRRRRLTFRRKRRTFRFARRRFGRPMKSIARYDGVYRAKCAQTDDFVYTTTSDRNRAEMQISWGYGSGTNGFVKYLQDNVEFGKLAAVFKEYRVMYVYFKFLPVANIFPALAAGSSAALATFAVQCGSGLDVDRTASSATLEGCPDYKSWSFLVQKSRSYKANRYFRNHNENWLPTDETYGQQISTVMTAPILGVTNNSAVGRVYIAWYCQFRGRII